MAGPIPTLGYPTRSDAVIALRAQGRTLGEIGKLIGISPQTVGALEHSARRAKKRHLQIRRIDRATEGLSAGILAILRPHAVKRDCGIDELMERILMKVAVDNLVDAVLDDAEEN